VDTEAQKLQAAIEAGDFGAIPEVAAAYRRSVALRLRRTANPAARRAILEQARELLNWSLQLAKARRARVAARLKAAEESAYHPLRSSLHSWEIEG
jgi:hypothetical protein